MHLKTPRPAAKGAAGLLLALGALAGLASGCSPALDWRDVRPGNDRLGFLLPCKPSVQERQLPLAGQTVMLALHACAAGGQTWGVASADLGDPARVGPALAELAGSATANIQGEVTTQQEARVAGATPHPGSRRLELRGRQPGGRAVVMHLVVFTHGTRVYQATVIGEQVAGEAVDTFFSALRITP